jgi:hypothetical protein
LVVGIASHLQLGSTLLASMVTMEEGGTGITPTLPVEVKELLSKVVV